MSRWQRVFETEVEYRAHIVKTYLEDQEIPAMVFNKQAKPYGMFGKIEVHVPADHVMRASHLINENIDFE